MKYLKNTLLILACTLGLFQTGHCTETLPNLDPRVEEILDYWFGSSEHEHKTTLWFGKNDAVDKFIQQRFEGLLEAASNGDLDSWKTTPQGQLALIILYDQFPRNMYRGSEKAFAYDLIAQALTLEGISQGDDQLLPPIQRVFFYLPLEHAENMLLQELSLVKFRDLVENTDESFQGYYRHALQHHDTIAQFGRFPYRNAALERISTNEELEFLKSQ